MEKDYPDAENNSYEFSSRGRGRKKIFFIIFLLAVLCLIGIFIYYFLFNRCMIKNVPSGHIRSEEHSSWLGFQDNIDFNLYFYKSADPIKADEAYKEMSKEDVEILRSYFDDFKKNLQSEKLLEKCSAAEEAISVGDYWLIDGREGQSVGDITYEDYDGYYAYFFDMGNLTLYYINVDF